MIILSLAKILTPVNRFVRAYYNNSTQTIKHKYRAKNGKCQQFFRKNREIFRRNPNQNATFSRFLAYSREYSHLLAKSFLVRGRECVRQASGRRGLSSVAEVEKLGGGYGEKVIPLISGRNDLFALSELDCCHCGNCLEI